MAARVDAAVAAHPRARRAKGATPPFDASGTSLGWQSLWLWQRPSITRPLPESDGASPARRPTGPEDRHQSRCCRSCSSVRIRGSSTCGGSILRHLPSLLLRLLQWLNTWRPVHRPSGPCSACSCGWLRCRPAPLQRAPVIDYVAAPFLQCSSTLRLCSCVRVHRSSTCCVCCCAQPTVTHPACTADAVRLLASTLTPTFVVSEVTGRWFTSSRWSVSSCVFCRAQPTVTSCLHRSCRYYWRQP